jgi:negative regulator of flagellin synthesis FlgM
LQGEVAAAPGVDLGRVEEIRQQIADGSYEIDADRVADALMTMEKELL